MGVERQKYRVQLHKNRGEDGGRRTSSLVTFNTLTQDALGDM